MEKSVTQMTTLGGLKILAYAAFGRDSYNIYQIRIMSITSYNVHILQYRGNPGE